MENNNCASHSDLLVGFRETMHMKPMANDVVNGARMAAVGMGGYVCSGGFSQFWILGRCR